MPTSLTPFVNTAQIDASDLTDVFDEIENHINGDVTVADFNSTAFIVSRHIAKPEFYGSPAPRSLGTSGDVHWRYRSNNRLHAQAHYEDASQGNWEAMAGLSATFHVEPLANGATGVSASVHAVFHAYEYGGLTGVQEQLECCKFALFVNETKQASTERSLFAAVTGAADTGYVARKVHTITQHITNLDRGMNDISIRININDGGVGYWQIIWVLAASFVVEVERL